MFPKDARQKCPHLFARLSLLNLFRNVVGEGMAGKRSNTQIFILPWLVESARAFWEAVMGNSVKWRGRDKKLDASSPDIEILVA